VIVVITEEAEAVLEQLGDAIAVDSPLRAISFVRELRGRCEGLAEFPKA
jgi:toxin ParE1/3/4